MDLQKLEMIQILIKKIASLYSQTGEVTKQKKKRCMQRFFSTLTLVFQLVLAYHHLLNGVFAGNAAPIQIFEHRFF